MTATPTADKRSEPGLDAFRCAAVVMMFIVHARRLQPASSRGNHGLADALLQLFMWAEPYIAATFLFVAGYSLVLSRRRASDARRWLVRLTRRAVGLYALSVLLFVAQFGVDLPDLLASSGILSAIAIALVLTGAALATPRPNVALAGLGILVLIACYALEATKTTISGLNGGPGGAVPLVAFTAFGALSAQLVERRGKRVLATLALVTLPPFALAVLSGAPWTSNVVSHYADLGGQLAVTALWEPGVLAHAPRSDMVFWNHALAGVAGLLLPLSVSLGLALGLPKRLFRARVWAPALLVGRHALAVYVMHLGVLGVLELVGLTPPTAPWTWICIAALFALAVAVSAALEHRPVRALLGARTAAQRSA